MPSEKRAILALMAAGRISTGEAERLIRAWRDGREELWIVLACPLLLLAQFHVPGSSHALGWFGHELAIQGLRLWQAAGSLLTKEMGGAI